MTQPRQYEQPSNGRFWSVAFGNSPVIGTAIHDGHEVRPELMPFMGLSDDERLREEDPFTGETVDGLTSHIVVHRSRFEIDLNRARDQAIYLKPEQSWGLSVWKEPLPRSMIDDSLSFHDDYYGMLEGILAQMQQRHGRFVVLDIHSYNHRRQGPSGALTPQSEAPDINIGTSSMDRNRWADVIDALGEHFASMNVAGRRLDVRENVAFQGKGEQTRFVHERFAENGCAVAVEFKKFFMDEWTGKPDRQAVADLRHLLTTAQPLLEKVLGARP